MKTDCTRCKLISKLFSKLKPEEKKPHISITGNGVASVKAHEVLKTKKARDVIARMSEI